MAKTSSINIQVNLDDKNVPDRIKWNSSDGGNVDEESKGMLLALFDKKSLDTVKIDIWTKEMQVVEMDRFFFQTLKGLSDTYFKATNNSELASAMRQFVQYFGEQTEIIPKK
jgi:gliding motility-associated protein GldC